jgi:Protein of unknown function (DUF2934)
MKSFRATTHPKHDKTRKQSSNTKKKTMPEVMMPSTGEPTNEEIAAVAHCIWEHEGRPEGRDLEHWLKAETQIRLNRSASL